MAHSGVMSLLLKYTGNTFSSNFLLYSNSIFSFSHDEYSKDSATKAATYLSSILQMSMIMIKNIVQVRVFILILDMVLSHNNFLDHMSTTTIIRVSQ